MDDTINRLAKEMVQAIAAAVASDPAVEALREKARAAGFEMQVSLDAEFGFANRGKSTALVKAKRPRRCLDASRARNQRERSPLPEVTADCPGRAPGGEELGQVA